MCESINRISAINDYVIGLLPRMKIIKILVKNARQSSLVYEVVKTLRHEFMTKRERIFSCELQLNLKCFGMCRVKLLAQHFQRVPSEKHKKSD